MKPRPEHPCTNCGANAWWWRETRYKPDEWVCGRCHPPFPKEENEQKQKP